MTADRRFTLDTNILIYAIDRDAGQKHHLSKKLISAAALCDCVLTLQTLGEFFFATTRKNLLDPSDTIRFLDSFQKVFDTVSATSSSLHEAIDIIKNHQISFWDAMQFSTAKQAGCVALLSEDLQDDWRYSGLTVINPFVADAETRLAEHVGIHLGD